MGDRETAQRRRRDAIVFETLLTCLLALGWSPQVFALDPSLDVSQYAHTSWKIRDGFVRGTIRAIAQTTDGVIWLGTEFGLLRFDGCERGRFSRRVNNCRRMTSGACPEAVTAPCGSGP
jgi:ligand-binding sensor domain-containing protein